MSDSYIAYIYNVEEVRQKENSIHVSKYVEETIVRSGYFRSCDTINRVVARMLTTQ